MKCPTIDLGRRKFTTKKNKTWDGDGILRVSNGFAYMEDASGREMGKTSCNGPLLPESKLSIGSREIEVDSLLSKKDYVSSRSSLDRSHSKETVVGAVHGQTPKTMHRPLVISPKATKVEKKLLNPATPKSAATQARFKNPVLETTVLEKKNGPQPTPRHDPSAEGALVMRRVQKVLNDKRLVDVVVDPLLSKHLREHQRDGVRFLYNCVMDIKNFGGQGAILADEMGLGKTLQTIALLWTLLKQNPVYEDPPVVKKALIVCPATLINNWRKEFRKWLGAERIGVFVVDDNKKRITDFTLGRTYSVIVISYEKLRTNIDELQKGHGIDIVIADEGHRLKKEQNKSGVAIRSLDTPRRIILSGTPIQNDLSEFFSMVNFVNPGILGSVKSFTKQFENPIVKSRQPEATEDDVEKGQERSEELAETTSAFILRRTADILSKYLPPKTEYILLCRPTKAQATVYQRILTSSSFQAALGGTSELHLQLITLLKKVCNSPRLLQPTETKTTTVLPTKGDPTDPDAPLPSLTASLISELPPSLLRNNGASAKLRVLDSLLTTISQRTTEKVVLVSHSTSCLDLLSSLLTASSLPHLRLDGSTPPKTRQDLVDTFNRTPASTHFAFLLSAKAGGQGLNLIGASRLVLFDVDWNPAVDAQAMARIHRDGQRRPCVVYRLLLAGALDEKIWQRQVTKVGLADSVMDRSSKTKGGGGGRGRAAFSRDELRDLFRLDLRDKDGGRGGCQTHELLGCKCGGRGMPAEAAELVASPAAPRSASEEDEQEGCHDGAEDDEDDDELFPPAPVLLKANQVDMEAQERRIRAAREREELGRRKRRRGASKRKETQEEEEKMQSLMEYAHIDTSLLRRSVEDAVNKDDEEEEDAQADAEALVRDDILLRVLKGEEGEEGRVSFVFARTSGGG